MLVPPGSDQPRLAHEPFRIGCIAPVTNVNYLDRHRASQFYILAVVNLAHTTAANNPLDAEIGQLPAQQRIVRHRFASQTGKLSGG